MAAPTSAAIRVVGRNRRQPYCADPDGQGQHERQADGRARRIPAPNRCRGRRGRHRALPRGLAGVRGLLGPRRHRLPAVLHPLHPQRQPGLDRGDRPLRPDVGHLHRRRHGDAPQLPHRRRAADRAAAAGARARAPRLDRHRRSRLPGAARLFLGADPGAHAVPAHDRHRPAHEPRLRRHRARLLPDAVAPDRTGVAQRAGGLAHVRRPRRHARTEERTHDTPHLRLPRRTDRRRARVHRARRLLPPLHPLHRGHPRLRDPAPHGRRHRQLPAAGRAVLHPRRQPHELGRHHQPHLRLRRGAGGLDARRSRARQHRGLGDLRGHVGHGNRRRRRPRHHRDQGHEGPWLQDRVRGRRHGGLGHPGPHHPAVPAVRDLRHDGQRLHRGAVPGRHRARRHDDDLHDALRRLLRPSSRHRPRPGVPLVASSAPPSSPRCRRCSPPPSSSAA